jgi:putative membrane protein
VISGLFAFLHHVAAFALAAGLAVELVLLRLPLTAASARRILVSDMIVGISAGVVLAVGLLRVFHFEKGGLYYANSAPFIAKMTLFGIVALMSIAPTLEFLSWRKAIKAGEAPVVSEAKLRLVRRLIHFELAGVVLILLAAALMARGVGFLG